MPLEADDAGLTRVSSEELVIRRVKRGRGTQLLNGQSPVTAQHHKTRIAALSIPPAWTKVRISGDAASHIQAIGRDAAGRLQYIYHSDWEAVRSSIKAQRLQRLLEVLPRIRRQIRLHLTPRSPFCALAAAARLIDRLGLRVGHEAYAGEESGRGVATLLKRHVSLDNHTVRVQFRGKGGKHIDKSLNDRKLVAVLRHLQELPGKRFFKLPTARGYRNMTATDVNEFLADVAGEPVTAKDFRTLLASCCAIAALTAEPIPAKKHHRRRVIMQVSKNISEKLTNTPAIVRKSYIHAGIIGKYEAGTLRSPNQVKPRRDCTSAEALLLDFLSLKN